MHFTKRFVLTSVAMLATAGMVGGSVLAANADEQRTASPPVAAEGSVPTGTPAPPSSEVPGSDGSGPRTMAGDGCDRMGNLGTSPSVRSMAVRAACYWKKQGPPLKRVKNHIGNGMIWVGGGTFFNREGKLPTGAQHHYLEFDMNAQQYGTRRDANRVILDTYSGFWYYTEDHYKTFMKFVLPPAHDEN